MIPTAIPALELPGGVRMPQLGLGVWQAERGRPTEQAVEWALEAGYRHIDTAALYRNEESVGAALRRSGLPREQYFVTTKLIGFAPDAERGLAASLQRLGLGHVDLYLIHFPIPPFVAGQWRALSRLRKRGLTRAIGVSNFGAARLARLVERSGVTPAVNQVELSPLRHRAALVARCRELGVVAEAYSPLARGKLTAHPVVHAIATRVGRTPAQVVLRWGVQKGFVVIPKSVRRERIRENAAIFDFELDAAAMAQLAALDTTRGTAKAIGSG